jgi:hypothetical protein
VTSNPIHLLLKDTGANVIANSMQLIAGRTAQEYNRRKGRHGAFWEDRYHATAVDIEEHLHSCLVYIDLSMVRAGVVRHPEEWAHNGYREIQNPPKRYGIIDLWELSALSGFSEPAQFQQAHRQWVEEMLSRELATRDAKWSEAIAVGSLSFVEMVKSELASKAAHREVIEVDGNYALREEMEAYGHEINRENDALRLENSRYWDDKPASHSTSSDPRCGQSWPSG